MIFTWKNQSHSIRDQHANLISIVSMIRNIIFFVKHIKWCCKIFKIFCQWFLLDLTFRTWHFNFRGLKLLGKRNIVRGLTYIDYLDQLYEWCLLVKHAWSSFPKKKPLELIHADICEPIYLNSFSKNKYFFTFYWWF